VRLAVAQARARRRSITIEPTEPAAPAAAVFRKPAPAEPPLTRLAQQRSIPAIGRWLGREAILALGVSVTASGERDGDERIATTLVINSNLHW